MKRGRKRKPSAIEKRVKIKKVTGGKGGKKKRVQVTKVKPGKKRNRIVEKT